MSISAVQPSAATPAITGPAPLSPVESGETSEEQWRALRPDEEATEAGAKAFGFAGPTATAGSADLSARHGGVHGAAAGSSHGGPPPATVSSAAPTSAQSPGELLQAALRSVAGRQARLDAAIEHARSGRTFSPQELLALQTQTHRFAHELNLVSKVVEHVSSGIKKTLETQI